MRYKLAAIGLGQSFVKVALLLQRQLDRRLILARKLQEKPRKFVLRGVGQRPHLGDGLFKQSGRGSLQPEGGRSALYRCASYRV